MPMGYLGNKGLRQERDKPAKKAFLVAEVSHCIGCSTTNFKNNLKQTFLGQPVVKLGNFAIGFPIICLRPDRHSDCHISAIAMQMFRSGAQLSKRKPGSDRYSDEHKYTKNPQ